jgi:hypothetical protein
MDTITREQAWAGASAYTRAGLAVYDPLVLGFNTPLVWKCPNRRIVDLYSANVSSNHLDIGVGSGYFLDRCRFPVASPRLALMDMNPLCTEHCARRLARYRPQSLVANVLEPLPPGIAPFDSVSMTYLLHCLPGTIRSKAIVFEHLRPVLNRGAVVFGASVLQGGVRHGWFARKMLASLNEKRIFCNRADDLDGLRSALARHFRESEVEVIGGVGVFRARS